MPLSIPVILGTTREGNRTQRVARFATDVLDARDEIEPRLYDAAELPFGDVENRVWEMEPRPDAVTAFVEAMGAADGVVLVTPEYNHGYPGALKNVLDHLYDAWNRKPFGLVTTGGSSGGIRAEEQLIQVITGGLGGVVVPASVNVHRVADVVSETGVFEDAEAWTRRVDRMADELVAYADAMASVRDALGD